MTWETTRISDMLSRHEKERDVLDTLRSMSFSTHWTAESYDTRETTGTSVALGLSGPPTMRNKQTSRFHRTPTIDSVAEVDEPMSPNYQASPPPVAARPLSNRDRTMLARDDTFSIDDGSVFGDTTAASVNDTTRAAKRKDQPAKRTSKTRFRKSYPEQRQESFSKVETTEPVVERREQPETGRTQSKQEERVTVKVEPVKPMQKPKKSLRIEVPEATPPKVERSVAATAIPPKSTPVATAPKSQPTTSSTSSSPVKASRKKSFNRGHLQAMEDLLHLVTKKRSERVVEPTAIPTVPAVATASAPTRDRSTQETASNCRLQAPEVMDDASIEAASIEASIEEPIPPAQRNVLPVVSTPVATNVRAPAHGVPNGEPLDSTAPCSPRSTERKEAVKARLKSFLDTYKKSKESRSEDSREERTRYSHAGDTYSSQGPSFMSEETETIDSTSLSAGNWMRENSMVETLDSAGETQVSEDQHSRSVSDIKNDALLVPISRTTSSSIKKPSEYPQLSGSTVSEHRRPEPLDLPSDPTVSDALQKTRADTPIVRSTRKFRRLVKRIWSCRIRSAADNSQDDEKERKLVIVPTGTNSSKPSPPTPTPSLLRRRIKPKLVDLDTSSEEESVEAVAVFTPGPSIEAPKPPLSPIQEEVEKLMRGAKAASTAAKDMLLKGNNEFCGLCTPENGFYPKEMVHKRHEKAFW